MSPDLSSLFPHHPAVTGPVQWSSSERVVDWTRADVHAHPVPDPAGVADAVATRLDELGDDGLVVGALPFDIGSGHPMLVATAAEDEDGNGSGVSAASAVSHPRRTPTVRFECSLPDRAGYAAAVQRIRGLIEAGEVDKVVLARRFRHLVDEPVDVDVLMDRLAVHHPGALRFRMPVAGGEFVGASPELLVSTRGGRVRSHPLAGSAPRSVDLREDEVAASRLRASAKDRAEHAYVTEAIADVLAPHCSSLVVPSEPSLVGTRTAWHLGTWIEGRLRDPDTPSALLASELHPTPAVCGTPRRTARNLITQIEGDRGYYAGTVGWSDARGDGEWAVAIRSAHVTATSLTAYAGAGIVAASHPETEATETEVKVAALLGAIDVVTEELSA